MKGTVHQWVVTHISERQSVYLRVVEGELIKCVGKRESGDLDKACGEWLVTLGSS